MQSNRQRWRRSLVMLLVLGLLIAAASYGYQQYQAYRHEAAVQGALETLLQNKFGS